LIRDARLSTYTDLLVGTLNLARTEAIKLRKDMTVCPAADPNAAAACGNNAKLWLNGAMIVDDGDPASVIRRESFQGGVTVTGTVASVVFSGTTGSASAAAQFKLCLTGRPEQQVNVLASGRVSKQINSAVVCP
jgi:type IV fimbrial biogenesis protein FimT